jgi:ABC-2 type transport system ATP-binding protein
MTSIVLADVSKWYGQVLGVANVTLTVAPGITGLLGPNGAGKTTLMKLIAGLLRPSRGRAAIGDAAPWSDLAARRRLGYCPEHEGLYEELTGLEFVVAMAELAGLPRARARERAEAALVRLGLADAMNRRLGGYSKGMRQRAKLAQALAHEPDVLLLDEPLTGCDPIARESLIEEIRGLGAAGKTVLVSSHVLYEVEALTHDIVVMFRGRVLAEGDIYRLRELIDEHPHRVHVECDRPRALAEALVGEDHVTRVAFEDGAIEIETRVPDRLYDAIPAAALARGVKIGALTSPDNNLQSVFEYLTEKK